MLFIVCEHYDDNQPIIYKLNNNEENECLICFEITNFDETNPISLRNQPYYYKICNCDCYIHKYCLKLWVEKNKKCLICREELIENNIFAIFFYKYLPYGRHIYFIILYISKKFFKIMYITFCVFLFIECYLVRKIFYYSNNNIYHEIDNLKNESTI
jgi:hypothetical protein